MFKKFLAPLILLAAPLWAQAQEKPLSPPKQSPVPLTVADQERARAEELSRKKVEGKKVEEKKATPSIKIPARLVGRHISSGNAALDALVHEAAARNGLDPCLIISVMRAESGFNRSAVSPKGASGLMQLMPATAVRFGVKNIFDVNENVMGGAKYLRWLLDRFRGDVRLALAGYNAGEGAVEFYGHRIPPFLETQNYVRTIYARYSGIHADSTPEPVVAAAAPLPTVKEKIPTYNQIIIFTSSSGDGPSIKVKQ
ncbi:MAG: lytic transglycosylase domain-containing protein [Blastocatellia bacterium]|nr:lytic transglycosylase domain-containing protein [Blastocatellia bacterium]